MSTGAAPRACILHAAVLLLSAVGIAYQIALMRVFTIGQWHHFASMIISMAMLGFGVSGALLAIVRPWLRGREAAVLRWMAVGLSVGIVACYVLSQQIPFETLQLVALEGQWANLLALYVLLSIPFFCVSTCIVAAFMLAHDAIGKVYFFNMLGSGLGAPAAITLLHVAHPSLLPYILAPVAGIAFWLLSWERPRGKWVGALVFLALALFCWQGPRQPIRISEYKGLSYALHFPDAKILARQEGPLSVITAVSSKQIRETPGQISNYPMSELGELPEQVGLFFDAGAVSPVNRFDGNLDSVAYLDYVTGAVAYRVAPPNPAVAILGSGGGSDVLGALAHGARNVTAIEVDPGVFKLVRSELGDFSGHVYDRADVQPVLAEARGHLQSHDTRFDLIALPVQGSFMASTAGVNAMSESYLYTVEALSLYLSRLTANGVLAMTCWIDSPPRAGLKLFATAVEAAEHAGIQEPQRHLACIRSWNTATVLVTKSPLAPAQVEAIRTFARDRWFDLCYLPGLAEAESNRYILLDEPYYFRFAQHVLSSNREEAYSGTPFYVRPATDDRPHFARFVKWGQLPRVMREFGTAWLPYTELGYLALVAALVQSVLVSLVLIVVPLVTLTRRAQRGPVRRRTLACCAALGFAYLFLELAFIQRFQLFLANPVYAVTVVLTAFLTFSGAGSLWAHQRRLTARNQIAAASLAIAACAGVYLAVLDWAFAACAAWPASLKFAASITLLAPLAFAMGIPFPTVMQFLSDRHEPLLPWAWGINGCASVVGALLASLIAVHAGFRWTVAAAIILYSLAALAFWRLEPSK
ncbi:MAG: SAM-dependent methyltransferase [Candidatus Hydrogenedentes bacterium]|nr:SAM-dependent methyltransferase [Candidatus Hydrogenedentota bacterium]